MCAISVHTFFIMIIYSTFTKDFILSKVSESAIFMRYLNIPNITDVISTPFRTDIVPSGRIYRAPDGRLRFNDYGTFWGDCFDLVARVNNININAQGGFKRVLNIIAIDFKLLDVNVNIKIDNNFEIKEATRFEYALASRFTDLDLLFWSKLNVSEEQLRRRRVCRLYNFFIDDIPIYRYNASQPAYIFFVGRLGTQVIFQAYFPYKEKARRYINNICNSKGLTDLTDSSFGVITKSYKDLLVLDSFGINVACTGNETKMITETEDVIIRQKMNNNVYTLFDNDNRGKRFSIEHKQKYGYTPLLLNGAKDAIVEHYNRSFS